MPTESTPAAVLRAHSAGRAVSAVNRWFDLPIDSKDERFLVRYTDRRLAKFGANTGFWARLVCRQYRRRIGPSRSLQHVHGVDSAGSEKPGRDLLWNGSILRWRSNDPQLVLSELFLLRQHSVPDALTDIRCGLHSYRLSLDRRPFF